ncbi:MAG: leucine-rich repeat domain-containing protein, partial [Verrucomicrobiaceae bacterium]
ALSDLTPLAGLTQLFYLDLENNRIIDIAPLSGLVNMEYLQVKDNQITTLTALSGMTKLAHLDLDHNKVSDVTPLASLRNLEFLDFADNSVYDLSPLAELSKLELLDADENRVVDLTPLTGMTGLRRLDLHANRIIDLTPLKDLPLTGLEVQNNFLDISPGSLTDLLIMAARARVEYGYGTGAPQRTFPLRITRSSAGVRLVCEGFRGLHYDLQGSSSLTDWPDAPLQSFSGADAETAMELPLSGQAASRFFRLKVSMEPRNP